MNNHYRAEDSLAYKRRRYTAKLHPEVITDLYERVNDGAIDINLAMLIGDILGPGDWRQDAACRDADPEWFFPTRTSTGVAEAKKLCADCPVRDECYEYANDAPEVHGIWAGHSTAGRKHNYSVRGGRERPSAYERPTLICVDCFVDLVDPGPGVTICRACLAERRSRSHRAHAARSGITQKWATSA